MRPPPRPEATGARWRLRRLAKMSPTEVAWRLADRGRQWTWAASQVAPGEPDALRRGPGPARGGRTPPPLDGAPRRFRATLPAGAGGVPADARRAVLAAADDLLGGHGEVLGTTRHDLDAPDWFLDPLTGRRAPQHEYCFRIDHRCEAVTGNVKQVWELSRQHHVTLLATAFACSGDERYALQVARQLRSWWEASPFLSGVHWTSGIEVGMRLVAWVWTRRLLEGWSGAPGLFEENEAALAQLWWHQRYLDAFRSRGSSANNHVIAEATGQLVAALAFDWFPESPRWAATAAGLLEAELARNTFPSGANREMAFDYHGFVAELALVAAVEAERAGRPLGEGTWELLARMLDVAAAVLDARLRAPRQGDGDDGRALALDPPPVNRWASLLAAGEAVLGAPAWWPATTPDATSTLVAAMAEGRRASTRPASRPARRPDHLADAGLTILRTRPQEGPEIWCRCDGGPHGYRSIAAHAHADALAVEVRYDGRDVLADPGTYCYHGEAPWRRYFRSTLAHNTIEIAGRDQSLPGGPFLWQRHARTRLVEVRATGDGEVTRWCAEHDGYEALDPPATHRRTVTLERGARRVEIVDRVRTRGAQRLRLAFHLGPEVEAELLGGSVALRWPGDGGCSDTARLLLPGGLRWSTRRGASDPPLGWYSARFGHKQPATTVLGETSWSGTLELVTTLQFSR